MAADPRTYRFQIRTHVRHQDPDWNEYGRVLWEETAEQASKLPLPFRVSTLVAKANEISSDQLLSVAAGTVWTVAPSIGFKPTYFVSPRVSELEPCLVCGAAGDHDPGCMVEEASAS